MGALILSMIFALFFILWSLWIYIESNVFILRKFKCNELSIEKIPMHQYFHWNN